MEQIIRLEVPFLILHLTDMEHISEFVCSSKRKGLALVSKVLESQMAARGRFLASFE